MSASSVTDWITAGSLLLLVVLFAHAIVRYGDEHHGRSRLWQSDSDRKWPEWAWHINKKVEHIMGVTEDIQGAIASLHEIVAEIAEYGNAAQVRIADLEAKLATAESEAADPATVEALKAEVAEVKAKADVLAATFPHTPAEPPAETPTEATE